MATPTTETTAVPVSLETRMARERAGLQTHSIARRLLFVPLLAAPLSFGAVQPWAWATLAVVGVVLLLLWGIGCVQRGGARIFWSPLFLPLGLLILLGMIQFFGHLTADPIGTREAILKLVTGSVFFFLASQFFANRPEETSGAFGIVVTIYAFLLSLLAILQFFAGSDYIYVNYWRTHSPWGAFGPYVNRDHYAGLMEMLIPVAAAYAFSRPSSDSRRSLVGFAVLLPIASALLTGSRGGFISLLSEILFLTAVLLKSGTVSRRRSLLTFGTLGIAAAAVLFFWIDPGQMSKRLAGVFDLRNSNDASYGNRAVVALDTLHIFRDHPWIGTGMGSFEIAYPRYQSLAGDDTWQHAHNDYAEALAGSGLVGGLLILSSLAIFFPLALGNLRQRLEYEWGWIQLGATLGCCGLLVHSFFDFNLHIPANALWFAVCAGVAVSSPSGSAQRLDLRTRPL